MTEPTVKFYRLPVAAPITGSFGEWYKRVGGVVVGTTADDPAREWQHRGLDLGAVREVCVSPVSRTTRAVAPYNDGSFGIAVCLDHGDGWYSLYAHLEQAWVVPGELVVPGQAIGVTGRTGGVPYHLHWQLSSKTWFPIDIAYSRNPLDYLEEDSVAITDEDLEKIKGMIAEGVERGVARVMDAYSGTFRELMLRYFADAPGDYSDAQGVPIPPDPEVVEAIRAFVKANAA